DALEALDGNEECRATVLAAQGTAFCAGARLGDGGDVEEVLAKRSQAGPVHLYVEAGRLFRGKKPIGGALPGAAVRGGAGPGPGRPSAAGLAWRWSRICA